jgi:X-Pro dipeptidyl-peptidase
MTIKVGALVLAAVTAMLPASSSVAAAPTYDQQIVEYKIETRAGTLHAEVVHATRNGRIAKLPAILTMSPYSALGRNGDAERWVPRGYHRVWVDVPGTGNSGGCYDYGATGEKQAGYDAVEWIAEQKWSTGKVAMIGGSYDGTTATATATMDPPHLTTIVPEAAISRWYSYAYSGGMRYAFNNEKLGNQGPTNGVVVDEQGFDTPIGFDFGFSAPPPLDVQSEDYVERLQSDIEPCEELDHTLGAYDFDTPTYDEFWLERDYVKDAHEIDIPVLVSHNWGDWNVKQEEAWNLFKALKNSPKKVLYMGTRWHNHGVPGGDYAKHVEMWMDHYLKGVDNGIDKLPSVISQTSDYEGALGFKKGMPKVRNVELIAQESFVDPAYQWKLLPSDPLIFGPTTPAEFPSTGINTETHMNHHARSHHDWSWFETPMLARDVRIFGTPKVRLWSTVYRRWVPITPVLVDVEPGAHLTVGTNHAAYCDVNEAQSDANQCTESVVGVTRGLLDSRYRNGLDKEVAIDPGRSFEATVVMKPQDYVFREGHIIGLQIATEILEWHVPKPPACEGGATPDMCVPFRVDWEQGQTRLVLPVVDPPRDPDDLFHLNHKHDKPCLLVEPVCG